MGQAQDGRLYGGVRERGPWHGRAPEWRHGEACLLDMRRVSGPGVTRVLARYLAVRVAHLAGDGASPARLHEERRAAAPYIALLPPADREGLLLGRILALAAGRRLDVLASSLLELAGLAAARGEARCAGAAREASLLCALRAADAAAASAALAALGVLN
jgi:hypothetical protein